MKVISKQPNSRMCLICGVDNTLGAHTRFYNMEDGSVCAILTYKNEHQSYPGRVHGGMICALLDELAGRTLWVKNPELLGVTATLTIKYRKPVPYGEELLGVAKMLKKSGRIFTASAKLINKSREVLAEAEGNFVIMPNDQIMKDKTRHENEINVQIEDDVHEIDV